jgi:hypothetical protein
MEFESSTPERVASAIAFGGIGFAAIGVAYVFPETPLLVFVMGMLLLGVGVTFATWNTVIHVERRARRVTKIQRVLLWTTIERYSFASFRSIKVARSGKNAVRMGTGTIYRLKLDGVPSLALPGNYDKRSADDNAVTLSRLMDVRIEGRQLDRRPLGRHASKRGVR